jgi:predicted alpha/beta-hydrolase family hydrolase
VAVEIETPHGLARAHVQETAGADSILVLGHGAGGGVGAPDLMIATRVALEEGFSVALVEQPYAVAGRRSPAPTKQLDASWITVVEQVAGGRAVIAGGRSSGARVACRTAEATGAVGVLCLAFPVHPPGKPEKTRLDELDAVRVPVLVVQGESDPFGMPESRPPDREVVVVPGDHGLKKDPDGLAQAVRDWLSRVSASLA